MTSTRQNRSRDRFQIAEVAEFSKALHVFRTVLLQNPGRKHLAKFFRVPKAILECLAHRFGQIDPWKFRNQLEKRAVMCRGAADCFAQAFCKLGPEFLR